jgi:hypothetical protein
MARGYAFLREELQCCHVSHSPRRDVDYRNKKGLAALGTQLGSRVSKTRSCVTKAHADVHAATVRLYNAASAQLTTPGHGYRGEMI